MAKNTNNETGAKKHMDLGDHLEYIESLLGGGGGGGNVNDVKVNGTSVVEDKVANIKLKTINNTSIVGEGNIKIEGGSSVTIKEINEADILTHPELAQEIYNEVPEILRINSNSDGIQDYELKVNDKDNNYISYTCIIGGLEIELRFENKEGTIDYSTNLLNFLPSKFVNNLYTAQETDSLLSNKQDTLISGSNIKTINNESILAPGNINTGLSDDIKNALLACFEHVAWTNNSGQLYYDTLYNLLYPPVPLLSISAVYTQSGVVYDTQTLDSLKVDLIVTGHYEDGSNRQIDPDLCTLSGTLVEGTSTITVTFDSKSTTFTVQVTHSGVPSEYETYDYITYTSSSGNWGQIGDNMIITDEFADMNKIKVDTYFRPKTVTASATAVMGGRQANGLVDNDRFWVIFSKTSTGRVSSFCHGVAVAVDNNAQISNLQLAHVITDPGTQSPASIQVNSDSSTTVWDKTGITNTAKVAFCGYLGTDYSSSAWQQMQNFAEVGRTKFYDVTTDTLVGDYVPCLRKADNIIGMFDIVTQTFHTTATAAKATRNGGSTNWDIGNWQ